MLRLPLALYEIVQGGNANFYLLEQIYYVQQRIWAHYKNAQIGTHANFVNVLVLVSISARVQ